MIYVTAMILHNIAQW